MRRGLLALLALLLGAAAAEATPITFVADGGYTDSATSPVAMAIPNSTCVNGNLMIMVAEVQSLSATSSITTPSGWTYITDFNGSAGILGYFDHIYAFYKYFSSDPSTINVAGTASTGFSSIDGNVRCYANTATSSPINSFKTVTAASGAGTGQTVTIPALTETYVSGEMYLAVENSTQNFTVGPGGFTPSIGDYYANIGSNSGFSLGDYLPSGPGAPGAMVMSLSGSNLNNANDEHGFGISILPATAAVVTVNSLLPLTGAGGGGGSGTATSNTFNSVWKFLPNPPPAPNNVHAIPALAFNISVGVNDPLTAGDASGNPSPTSAATHISMLNYVGVKSIRAGAYDINTGGTFATSILSATGAKIINYYGDQSTNVPTVISQFEKAAAAGVLIAGEGPNEPYNQSWGSFIAPYMNAQWAAIRADSNLNGIPWTSVTLNGAEPGSDAGGAGGNYGTQFAWAPGIPAGAGTNGVYPVGTQFSDIASIHDYPNTSNNLCPCTANTAWDMQAPTTQPSFVYQDFINTWSQHYSGITNAQALDVLGHPRVSTEWDMTPGTPEYQAVGVADWYIDAFARGFSITTRFQMIEGYTNTPVPPTSSTQWHQGYFCNPGANTNDCTGFTPSVSYGGYGAYPSADYVHSMTHFMADTGDVISPGTVNWCGGTGCTLGTGFTNAVCGTGGANGDPLCHGLLLQKSSSAVWKPDSYDLLIDYEPADSGPTVTVPLSFGRSFSQINVYDLTTVVTPAQSAPVSPTPIVSCGACSSISISWGYFSHPSGGMPPPLVVELIP